MKRRDLLIRFFVFSLMLVAAIYAMRSLKKDGLDPSFLSVIGIQANQKGQNPQRAPKEPEAQKITWCPSPVVSLTDHQSKINITFDGQDWRKGSKKLDLVRIEQWLLAHCRLKLDPTEADFDKTPEKTWEKQLSASFEDKSSTSIYVSTEESWYKWDDKIFKSEQLTKALKEIVEFEKSTSFSD